MVTQSMNYTGDGNDSMFPFVTAQFDYDSGDELTLEIPSSLLVPLAVVLSCLLMVGVIGNLMVISVFIRTRCKERSRFLMATSSTTSAYILNLSAADLLFLIFCAPFQGTVYILNHWPYGWMMCKVAHYLQFCTVTSSVWILTMMSVDRYVAIGHPLKSVKWRHPRQATRISIAVWVSAAVLSLPWLILYEADEHDTGEGEVRVACYDAWSDSTYHYRKWMILFVFMIDFLIPSFIIFCMAIMVAKSIRMSTGQPLLRSNSTGTDFAHSFHQAAGQVPKVSISNCAGVATGVRLRRRRRVGWLVFGLAFLFFVCWTPHNLSMVWLNFDPNALDWIHANYQTFFIVKVLAHMMTYMNSCINPVFYSLASNHFRARFASVFGPRNGREGQSMTTFNSSFRYDNRTLIQIGQGIIWRRSQSSHDQQSRSYSLVGNSRLNTQRFSFPRQNRCVLEVPDRPPHKSSAPSGLEMKSLISKSSRNLSINVQCQAVSVSTVDTSFIAVNPAAGLAAIPIGYRVPLEKHTSTQQVMTISIEPSESTDSFTEKVHVRRISR